MSAQPGLLTGRVALVLGASSPAAGAVATVLAAWGADVALTGASGDAEEAFALRRLARGIGALGRRSLVESLDLGNGASVQVGVRQIVRQLGRLDIAVVASDAAQERPSERLSDADWTRLVNANLGAVFFACRACLREMRGNEAGADGIRGRIVVLLPALLDGQPAGAVYSATCVAAQALVRSLALEWQESGVRLNAVALAGGLEGQALTSAVTAALGRLLAPEGAGLNGEVLTARA